MRLGLQQQLNKLEKLTKLQNTNRIVFLDITNKGYVYSGTDKRADIENIKGAIIINDIPKWKGSD